MPSNRCETVAYRLSYVKEQLTLLPKWRRLTGRGFEELENSLLEEKVALERAIDAGGRDPARASLVDS